MNQKIKIGISACLLGEKVRYNGGHQLDRYITETLGNYFDFVPVCPEVECGLPVPRESMHLEGDPKNPRLVTRKTGVDHTGKMQAWARGKLHELDRQKLCGFIFKSKSPSSGMERIGVKGDDGKVRNNGVGIFARAFMDRFPHLPVEEDGRLHDIRLRENFIESVFLFQRWRNLLAEQKNRGGLVEFHTENKLLFLAHNEKVYREMGRLVAHAGEIETDTVFHQYETMLTAAMRLKPTTAKHTNVLMHILGYFKKVLTPDEKQELIDIIEQYRPGITPLIVPLTLINHYVRKYDQPYLARQYYLHPHPMELKLRNHA